MVNTQLLKASRFQIRRVLQMTCPDCRGTGYDGLGGQCDACDGTGEYIDRSRI